MITVSALEPLLTKMTNIVRATRIFRSEEHTSELQSRSDLVCRLLLEKKKKKYIQHRSTIARHADSFATSTLAIATLLVYRLCLLPTHPLNDSLSTTECPNSPNFTQSH